MRSDSTYRYGFNGMERDDEVSGEGNSYDFGARVYDPRVGRWWSPDALTGKYPGISTYSFSFNNPVVFADPSGKEGSLTIDVENRTITLQTTIHLYGKDATPELAESYNNYWGGTRTALVTYEGVSYTVNITINFVVNDQLTEATENDGKNFRTRKASDYSNQGVGEHDNILEVNKAEGTGSAEGQTNYVGGSSGVVRKPILNQTGGKIGVHEGLHMLGYDERYNPLLGFVENHMDIDYWKGDIMTNMSDGHDFKNAHFYHLTKVAIEHYKASLPHNPAIGPPAPSSTLLETLTSKLPSGRIDCTAPNFYHSPSTPCGPFETDEELEEADENVQNQ